MEEEVMEGGRCGGGSDGGREGGSEEVRIQLPNIWSVVIE